MNFSCLSAAEVRERYRRADNKQEIISILADLTCCSRDEMREFLGLDNPKRRKEPKRIVHKAALLLYNQGLNDREIAKRLDVSDNSVHLWRRRNNLPQNYKIYTERDESNRMELYKRGLNDRQIGDAVGICPKSVCNWRRKRGLPANAKRGQYDRR